MSIDSRLDSLTRNTGAPKGCVIKSYLDLYERLVKKDKDRSRLVSYRDNPLYYDRRALDILERVYK